MQDQNQNRKSGQDQNTTGANTNWQNQQGANTGNQNKDTNSDNTEVDYPQQPRKEEEPMVGNIGRDWQEDKGTQQANMRNQDDMNRQSGKSGQSDQRGDDAGQGNAGGSDYKRNMNSGQKEEDMSNVSKGSQSQGDRNR